MSVKALGREVGFAPTAKMAAPWYLVGLAIGLLSLGLPEAALAQCATSGTDPITLTCATNTTTTATTNTTSPSAATSDRTQQFNADLIGQINSGVTVSGVGLQLLTTKAGGGISLTNSGAVSITTATPNAVELDGNGGTVSYGGAGTISTTALGANGLVLSNAGAGNIDVNTTGGIGGGGTKFGTGVAAATTSGAINVTTGAISAIIAGITASSGGGGITILANGNIGGVVLNQDIATSITGGTGNTSITYNGALSSGGTGGILATSSSTGTMSVGGSGSISSALAGSGISVTNSATSTSGDITVNPTGTINAGGFNSIRAAISNAANNANIVVAPTAALTGGIAASTAGGGNVTVTEVSNITAIVGAGIATATTSGTSTLNIAGGTVQAATNGVDATAGGGKTIVSNAGTITASLIGVKLTGGNGNAVTNSGAISGVTGLSTSAGSTSVFNAGAITGSGGTAIQFAGSGNTLTIAPTSVINGNAVGAGSDAFQLGGSGTGSFVASLIGPAARYRGFAAYNKVGDSTWTLTGTNALVLPWTVEQGTLDVAGSLSNASFTVQAGVLAVTGTIGTATVNGGSFSVLGGGLSGAVTENAGTASIDGTTGAFTLNGGTLFGNGTVGGLTVTGGMVAPGHSIGTLHVAGNVGFSGGVYQVETNLAGLSDKIVAMGAASLTGGTVQAVAQAGSYTSPITYTILTANGGVSGAFSGATSGLSYLTPTLSYDADDVFLTLARNPTFFRDQALTSNQRAVAGALDQLPTTNSLFLATSALTGATTRQALDSLSGEIHASVQSSLIGDSLYLREAVLGRMRQGMFASSPGAMAGFGGPAMAYQAPSNTYAAAFPVKAMPSAPPVAGYDYAWWAQCIGARGTFDGNAADMKRSLGGFVTGIDRSFGANWIAGIAAGYSNSALSVDSHASSANVDTALASAYAAASFGPWNLRSGLGFAWNSIDTSRTIAFPGFLDRTTARYGALTSQAFGEVGYAKTFGTLAVEPFAGLSYVHLDAGGFTEKGLGLGAALAGQSANENVGYASLGVRLAESFALVNGMSLVPHLAASWQHAYGDVTPVRSLAFVSPTLGFSIAGVPLARDAAVVDGGLDLKLSPRARFGITYFGTFGAQVRDQAAKGTFTLNF
jgi:uncharacterized protein with beta-barrel porin domain